MVQLIVVLLVLVLVVFPAWAIYRILALGKQNDALAWQLTNLERQLEALRDKLRATPFAPSPEARPVSTAPAAMERVAPVPLAVPPPAVVQETVVPAKSPDFEAEPHPAAVPPALPPVTRPLPHLTPPTLEPSPLRPRIDWEQFMGAKMFAWLGGAAAFLGAVFFVKYSFEHDLIPPEVRVALGFLFGLGLIIGGLTINRTRYAVTVQTLCATGIVVLYAVTFACNSIYHFAFFGPLPTFLLMALITAAAFALAIRLDAQVVAVLGMLGGFLTPVLLSTGRDNPPGLFGYIALLDVGLIAVALYRRWHFLVALAAAGTIVMQIGWAGKFFEPWKASMAMIVCLSFCALFLAAYGVARKWTQREATDPVESPATEPALVSPFILWSAIAFPFVALGFAAAFLGYATIAVRPGLLFTFVVLADAGLLALAWIDEQVSKLHLAAGIAVFALFAAWTGEWLTAPLLPWALAFYLVYAVLHSAFPLVLERHRPDAAPTWWSQLFPPLTLLLMLGPLFKLDPVPLALWPCILLIDLLAIGLAMATASLAAVAVVLVLTLGATALWILRVPVSTAGGGEFLLVIGGFAVLFFVAGLFVARRLGRMRAANGETTGNGFGDPRAQIPAMSALLPFLLLIMMTQRVGSADPSPIFGLALLLVALTLGLAAILVREPPAGDTASDKSGVESPAMSAIEWLPACALGGVAALAYAWHARHFSTVTAGIPLGWYLGFTAVFMAYPFAFRRRFAALTGPWAVAALAGVLHFPLVYRVVRDAWPNEFMGVLPALFAVAPLLSLVAILRLRTVDERARLNQLAWYGGVALLFITLIFPIQFERQWITIGWALEGVALLWLFQRVPHPGLRGMGAVLLVAAFVRLALNPAVLKYHARAETPVFNWYLYSYGLVTVCLFVGARLLASDPTTSGGSRGRTLGVNAAALLNALGVVLAFLLLNLEIADFFSVPGSRVLTFEFSGNFGRDMTYTIAWSLFALALLLVSIWKRTRAGRYAAMALLGIALLKLFLHDLARLEALYRIGALFAVAIVAIIASVAYQRFLPGREREEKP
ncbi:MAG: DUF2339 domain-containing protein [Opitutaceae bacterium]|nr:DUF2339 domain-containing protein [Opitutaceae bacterium]